ncbi:MAG TPA: Ig-like domain-containing protein [Oligoflexia bacterium]|nr:Ig-like domain-containing protein [Oligoflexia bacterium]HMR25147.1 Ig-like domain-containing protein [Oligoflexia bacterium]
MRYKYIILSSLVLIMAFVLNGCGPVDNFQNQRQISLETLALQSTFVINSFHPNYSGQNPPTNVGNLGTNVIQATFSENCDQLSLQASFRLTETIYNGPNSTSVADLTNTTTVLCSGPFATFTINTPNGSGGALAANARYELTIFQTARSAQGQNLKYLNIYKMYTNFNFDNAGAFGFTDPANPPRVIDVNYYEICGQPYMFIFFSEDLARAPLVRVKTGVIGTFIGLGDPTYSTWPAYSGRMDVFGVHINSGGALSGHNIKIFKNDVVDLQGDTMEADYQKGGLFQLISPC